MIGGPEGTGDALRRVGAYNVLRIIGRGGAATVHLATQDGLDRTVALKQLTPGSPAGDLGFAQRFVKEARLLGRLSHPNVVTVFDYLETGGSAFIVMEYLGRGSLRPFIGLLSDAQVIGVLDGVLAGLEYAERMGIVHRDLKPENLLVSDEGAVKIADFGIARLFDRIPSQVLTAQGSTLGTPYYMAPEQVTGGELGPHTDLFALGIVAWELFAGRLPFETDVDPHALLYARVHVDVRSLATARSDLDPRLGAWVAGLLAREPDARTAGARRAREQLDEIAVQVLGPHWRRLAELPGEAQDGAGRPATLASGLVPAGSTPWPAAALDETRAALATPTGAEPAADGGSGRVPAIPAIPAASAAVARRRPTRGGGLRRAAAVAAVIGAALAGLAVALGGERSGSTADPSAVPARAQTVYFTAVARTLRTLAEARAAGIATMRSRRRLTQARGADDVSDAYDKAAVALRRLPAPGLQARAAAIASRLAATARAYDALARGARSQSARSYRTAARAVRDGERELDALVERIGIVVDRGDPG